MYVYVYNTQLLASFYTVTTMCQFHTECGPQSLMFAVQCARLYINLLLLTLL